ARRTRPTVCRRLIQRDSSSGAARNVSVVSLSPLRESLSQSTNPAAPCWVIRRTLARCSAGRRWNQFSRSSIAETLAEAMLPEARSRLRRVSADNGTCDAESLIGFGFYWPGG